MSLEGRKFIVTGGSRGIGAGIVKHLASKGAKIAFTFTSRPDAAEQVLSELPGSGHKMINMNVADAASVEAGINEIFTHFGSIDGLVNNAGITRDQLLLRMKPEDFDAVINANLKGTYLCSQAVLKPLLKARAGSIVNITSVIGHSGNAGQANYAASKAGVEGFSKSLALEIASRGIRVNCVAPGFIATEMTDQLNDTQKAGIMEKIPLNKIGDVSDVAACVEFLLSDGSRYMTGQTLHVNGGLYM